MEHFSNFFVGWCDIGYNFLIGGDGAVYTARGWDKVGAHTMGYNDIAIAFSLMGNFELSPVPQNMLDTAQALIECATGEAVSYFVRHKIAMKIFRPKYAVKWA